MSALAELQRRVQAAVLRADAPDQAPDVVGNRAAGAAYRLGIYRHAYRARRAEALAAELPLLHALLGGARFGALAAEHLQATPSRAFSMREVGAGFAGWLRDRGEPAAAAIADFEWARRQAFDAPDQAPVALADLALLPPSAWATLRLCLADSAQLLALDADAFDLANAVATAAAGDTVPALVELDAPVSGLVWRRGHDVHWRALPPDEAAMLAAARQDADFGELCATLTDFHAAEAVPARAIGLLKLWIEQGLVVGLDATAAPPPDS